MTSPLQARYEKILLGLAVLSLTASSGWLGQRQGELRRLRTQPLAAQLGDTRYEPAALPLPESSIAVWPKATAQAQGPGWLYEVFTPPVIYYNASARSFSVTAPTFLGELTVPFGLELLAVQQEQFRLQLAGYFGAPGDYLVAFTSPARPETLFAREGRRFADLGLTLKSFDVRKIVMESNEARPVYDVAALAVLTDDRTGTEVVLDSRVRKYTDTPLAVLQPLTGGSRREVREGDTFADETSTYRIERIQLDPPEVVVARTTPGLPQPETRILRPAAKSGGLAGPAAGPKTFPPSPVTGLATSGK